MTTQDPNRPARPEHVAVLLAAARAPCDRALVALVAYAGLRPTQACALRVEDVAGDAVRLGTSESTVLKRIAPLSPAVADAVRAAAGDRTHGPFLVTRTGTPLGARRAVARLKTLARTAGLDGTDGRPDAPTLPQLRAHAFEHTAPPDTPQNPSSPAA